MAGQCAILRQTGRRVDFRTDNSQFRRLPELCCRVVVLPTGARNMRRTTPRSIAISRRSGDVQTTSLLGAIGMVAMLMGLWASLVL
jgi:predicted nuclease with RNAse H fold